MTPTLKPDHRVRPSTSPKSTPDRRPARAGAFSANDQADDHPVLVSSHAPPEGWLSRRRALTAIGVGIAGAGISTDAAVGQPSDDADRLYRAYIAAIPEGRRLDAAYDAAVARVPEWVRPGPCKLAPDGSYAGEVSCFPIDTRIRPAPYLNKLCRPGPENLRRVRDTALTDGATFDFIGRPVRAEAANSWYRTELREFVLRRRAADAEEAAAGVPDVERAIDLHCDRTVEIRARVEALPPSSNSAAAVLLLGATEERADAYADRLPITALAHLRPALTGLISEHVELLLDTIKADPLAKLNTMPFYG